jgi:hypothetical protein
LTSLQVRFLYFHERREGQADWKKHFVRSVHQSIISKQV